MPNRLKVIVEGVPQTKPSTSFFRKGGRVHTFNKSTSAKNQYKWLILSSLSQEQKEMLTCNPFAEIHVRMRYFLPIPKSSNSSEKSLMEWGILPFLGKPDLDNLTKFSYDVGNEILWPDDRQITLTTLSKKFSKHPRTEYEIEVVNRMITNQVKDILEIYAPEDVSSLIDDVWELFSMYDTPSEIERIDDLKLLDEKLCKTAQILSRIARNHSKKLTQLQKKCPDLDIQNYREKALS